jgi:hypothetical protein
MPLLSSQMAETQKNHVIARSGKVGALERRGNLVAVHKYFANPLCIRRDCHAALAMTWFFKGADNLLFTPAVLQRYGAVKHEFILS